MWGILLIPRRIVVEELQRGRSALRLREREREMEGSHCVGVWPGWIALEKERDHAWMYTIAKI